MGRKSGWVAAVVICGVALMPVDALAYLDAGTGSMLLQVIIAGICAVALFFNQLKSWIFKGFRK